MLSTQHGDPPRPRCRLHERCHRRHPRRRRLGCRRHRRGRGLLRSAHDRGVAQRKSRGERDRRGLLFLLLACRSGPSLRFPRPGVEVDGSCSALESMLEGERLKPTFSSSGCRATRERAHAWCLSRFACAGHSQLRRPQSGGWRSPGEHRQKVPVDLTVKTPDETASSNDSWRTGSAGGRLELAACPPRNIAGGRPTAAQHVRHASRCADVCPECVASPPLRLTSGPD